VSALKYGHAEDVARWLYLLCGVGLLRRGIAEVRHHWLLRLGLKINILKGLRHDCLCVGEVGTIAGGLSGDCGIRDRCRRDCGNGG